jgi:hypothetical protein
VHKYKVSVLPRGKNIKYISRRAARPKVGVAAAAEISQKVWLMLQKYAA